MLGERVLVMREELMALQEIEKRTRGGVFMRECKRCDIVRGECLVFSVTFKGK